MRRRLALAGAALAGAATLAVAPIPAALAAPALPAVRHVFVLLLENENHDVTFGPGTKAPYLANELTARGQHLDQYHGIGHLSLDNYLALVSGQAPNPLTQADCPRYVDVAPGVIGPDGQAVGAGCVYPATVKTVADQLEAKGLTWRGYMEDMGNTPGQPATCRHPAIGATDDTQTARKGDQYATRHNPFVYFHSIIDRPACAADDVPLDRLPADLAGEASTPNLVFITPNLCHDGHDAPCVDGEPGGLTSADAFLRRWVPAILASPAYKSGGMLVVTFDEASNSDAAACCGEQPGPSSPLPGITGPGGGRTGAVVLSPFVSPGTLNHTPYNHYSLLRTIEDLFGLGHLGMAGRADLTPFGPDVFNASAPAAPTAPTSPTTAPATTRAPGGAVLPVTGRSPSVPAGLGLLAAGAALAGRVRRARRT